VLIFEVHLDPTCLATLTSISRSKQIATSMLSKSAKVAKAMSRFTAVRGFKEAVIVSAARTPLGSFGGALASLTAPKIGAVAMKESIIRAGIAPEEVGEVMFGNVCTAGVGQAPARQAALFAGLPEAVPCQTMNKVCASGLKAVAMAATSIMAGQMEVVLAGGQESMSNIPYYLPGARTGLRMGDGKVIDGMIFDGLWDPYNNQHMGMCGEVCAEMYGFSREDQDAFAIASYTRAAEAWKAGLFDEEIVPVTIKSKKGEVVFDHDEEYGKVKVEKIPTLRAAFKKDGTVTAANASGINDGAAALIVMEAELAKAKGLKPLARIVSFGDAAQDPVMFTTAPALAMDVCAKKAGMDIKDVEYHEINEAFSVVAMANMQIMNLDHDRVNVNGGAVALGHPIGGSGARILTTLLSVLKQKDATVGAASICNGGGGASAMIVERM
jgi:acetyl-CoA C-acetyltransferase